MIADVLNGHGTQTKNNLLRNKLDYIMKGYTIKDGIGVRVRSVAKAW